MLKFRTIADISNDIDWPCVTLQHLTLPSSYVTYCELPPSRSSVMSFIGNSGGGVSEMTVHMHRIQKTLESV